MSVGSFAVLVLLALALALKPWPILAVILFAASPGGASKARAFVVGWALVLVLVGTVTVLLPGELRAAHGRAGTPHATADLLIGAILAAALLWRWRVTGRRDAGGAPAWVARVDSVPPPLAFALGVFMPSYILMAAAVNQLLATGWAGVGLAVTVALFVALASAGVAAPVLLPLVRPDGAAELTERWRAWLLDHRRVLAYLLSGVLAVALMVKGLIGLLFA